MSIKEGKKMSIGINTNIEYGLDTKTLYQDIKSVGFKNIMIAFKETEIEESILCAKDLGLNIPYVHLSCREINSIWVKSPITDKYMAKLKKEIDLCSKYNIPIAVIHPIAGNPNSRPVPVNPNGLNAIREIVDYAKDRNVKLAIENVDIESLTYLDYILENISKEDLGFCYDAGHNYLYYPENNVLEKYGDRVIAIHLHDNLMDYEEFDDYTKDRHMLPFDGKINFEKVCATLANSTYDNVIMVEVNKKNFGNPDKYNNLTMVEFLTMAKNRAEMLEKMVKEKREN